MALLGKWPEVEETQVIYEYLCIIFLSLFLTKELFSHIHVDGTVDSLFSATLVP